MLNLLGFNDANLKPFEERFASSISIRGDVATVKGTLEEVDSIEKIFKEMTYVLNTTNKLKQEDVSTIIDLTLNGRDIISNEDYNSIVLYTKKDVIKAKTETQLEYVKAMNSFDICFGIGPAGTGKTYLAVAFAISQLKKGVVKKIVLARPAVEAGESLGFLPGDFKEKIDPYLRPLYDALQDMLPNEQLKNYMERNIIEIVPLAYMRGRTLNNSYIILDEAQNSTNNQMKMFLTRIGPNSKALITGDITQIDLPKKVESGLILVKKILMDVDGVGFVFFKKADVVRHKLVKDIIQAYEKYNGGESENRS
ncbi:MAG: PhoH family protein [Ignavibacteriae bacterium]|nr:PhoH family protein [Ignavibacteriota bacterium]MCB0750585.1 PhoH family protein [Ignavibacteriota bacterium]MCB9247311.1 PhoH family protein [Ignavibacteriales bacterium]